MPGINANTSLCVHFDGADGATSAPDSSPNAHTLTAVGNAQIDTGQSVFGGAASQHDGTGDGWTIPNHASLALGNGDFVVDCRFLATFATKVLIDWGDAAGSFLDALYIRASSNRVLWRSNASDVITSTASLSNGTWYHVAVVRKAGTTRLFIDGVQTGSDFSDSRDYPISADGMSIGMRRDALFSVAGHIDELRFQKGTSEGLPGVDWFDGFTPPAEAYSAAVGRSFGAVMG